MKKCFTALLCFFLLSSTVATAFASEAEPDYIAEYEAQYGKMPVSSDFLSDEEYQEAYDVWLAGFIPYVDRRAAEWSRQQAVAAENVAEEDSLVEASPTTPIESAGSKNDVSSNHADTSVDSGFSDKYPVGSYVTPAGNVYAPDGTLLSPGTTPAMEPDNALAADQDENGAILPDEQVDQNNLTAVEDPDTLAVIAGLVSDMATDPPVWYIEDLRPTEPPAEVLTGMKALVTSIFGEYTPVTTTSVVSQTVGNDTQQYLLETVAPGAAGIDYEWVAGVVLFAIMLFCLMKLLGGVLK